MKIKDELGDWIEAVEVGKHGRKTICYIPSWQKYCAFDGCDIKRNPKITAKQQATIEQELVPMVAKDLASLLNKVIDKRLHLFAKHIIEEFNNVNNN